MAAAASNSSCCRLQSMLQAAVQSIQWTYSIFWRLCPQQGILKWGEGYYNGAIKTRKTVQLGMEVSNEEASLQRSQQLRDLYEMLCGEEESKLRQTRWPCAALSPEDLTESEWFYLLCVSFSFHPSVGLIGTAYARKQHIWLTGANQVDCQTFTRAILAKSANIQTVVCIPLLDGVVEFGTTDKVEEDHDFIQHVKSFFRDYNPKPAISEHSASSSYPAAIAAANNYYDMMIINDVKEEEKLLSETEIVLHNNTIGELMDLVDTLDDIRVGSSCDHGSSNLMVSYQQESTNHMWGPVEEEEEEPMAPPSAGLEPLRLQQPTSELVNIPLEHKEQGDDTHYSQTVSTILQNTSVWLPESPCIPGSFESAFIKGIPVDDDHHHLHGAVTSQSLLKYILFSVPHLHANNHRHQTPEAKEAPPQPEALSGGGHVMAERRRREKLNERFIILRSLVPFVTKTDKASILGDTIEYVKQLRVKLREIEARNRRMKKDEQRRTKKRRVSDEPVEVSIIEGDALLEVECLHREGLLVDLMRKLRELGLEVTVAQSSVKDDGLFAAEFRANVKENDNGKKASVVEVKKALNQIILSSPSPSFFSDYYEGVC